MFITDIEQIRIKMNEWGRLQQPFLFAVNFEMTEGFFIENPTQQNNILFQLKGKGNKSNEKIDIQNPYLHTYPISSDSYKNKFDIVNKGLRRGDSFLTNLTIKTPIDTNLSLDEIFIQSTSPYQLLVPNKFICFSPERFVKISRGKILTNPMKGTIDAAIPNAEQIILNDFKETAEHNTIVDLLRNDLSIIANNVNVKRFRYIDRIKAQDREILQVSSEIEGTLSANYNTEIGDIIFKMLPAGSISGAPKQSTIQIIREAEKESRGYYTGIFGYYDGIDFDSAVLIRFIEKEDNQMFFRSGGGITVYSDSESEYKEALNKIYLPFV